MQNQSYDCKYKTNIYITDYHSVPLKFIYHYKQFKQVVGGGAQQNKVSFYCLI